MGRLYFTNDKNVVLKEIQYNVIETRQVCNEVQILHKLRQKYTNVNFNLIWLTHDPWYDNGHIYLPLLYCQRPLFTDNDTPRQSFII